jgi:hypothetical protein
MGITLTIPNNVSGPTITGTLGNATLPSGSTGTNIAQNSATTNNQYLNGTIAGSAGSNTAGTGTASSGTGGTTSNISALLSQINDQANNIVNNGQTTFANSANGYQTQANSLLSTLQAGQSNVNNEITQAEMNKQQSLHGLMNDVGNGLRSGGVQLASGNALDSSAANALARAYSNYATTQRGTIGQTEAGALSKASQDQNTLNSQQQQGLAQLSQMRNDAATSVGNDVATQLQNLDYQANSAGITGKVQIQALKQQVVNEGLAKLSSIDQWLQGQLASVTPQSTEQAAAAAYGQLQQGASNMGGNATFNTNTNITPVDAQGNPVQGAFDSLLPLYLRNNNNQQQFA